MSTPKNQSTSRTAQPGANTASIATAATNTLPPIVPIKYNEAIIDTVRSPVGTKLTPIASGATIETGTMVFEGRATANKQIIIFDKGVEIARVITSPSGKWVWSSNEFNTGDHNFTVQVVGAGNPVSASYDVSVGALPETPVEVLFAVDDTAGYSQYIASGASTTDNTPRLSGTAKPNSTIQVFDGSREIAVVQVDPRGNWNFTPTLSVGSHSLVFVSGQTKSEAFVLNVVAPEAPPLEITNVYDNSNPYLPKLLKSGDITQDTTPRFDGKAGASVIIRLYNNGDEIGSTQADPWGYWSLTPSIKAGSHNLVFKASDGSESKPFALNITSADAQPVEVTYAVDDSNGYYGVPLKSGDTTQDTTPRFNGKAGANVIVRVYSDGKEIGSTQADSWGNWGIIPKLSAGNYNLVFKAGEGSESKPFALTIASADAQPIEIYNVIDDSERYYQKPLKSGDSTQDTTPRFNGKAGANVLIRLFDGERELGSTYADAYGNWSLTPNLPAGSYNLVFKAGEGSVSKPFALNITSADSQPIEIYAALEDSSGYNRNLAPGSIIKDTTPYFYGKAGANVIVRLYNGDKEIGSTKANAYGDWSLTPTLQSGSYNLVFKAGEGSETKPFPVTIVSASAEPVVVTDVLDNSAGYSVPISSGATSLDTTPRFIGRAGANILIKLYNGDEVLGSVMTDPYGNWTLTPTLPIGDYNLVFKTAEGTASAPFIISIAAPEPVKPQAPEIELIIDNVGKGAIIGKNETTDDDTPTLQGTAAPNSLVEIYDNNQKIGERRVSSTGFWEFTPVNPAYLSNGKHSLVVKSSNGTESEAWDIIINVPVSVELVGSNSGEETGDHATADTTPFFSGFGPKGVLIRLYEGDKEIGSVVTSARDGSWKIDITDAFTSGSHTVVAKVAGTDNVSAQFDFTITAPVEPEVPVEPESPFQIAEVLDGFFKETGALKAGEATDDNRPNMSGVAPANTLVRIFDNGIEIGSVMANGDGAWAFKPATALDLGPHTLTVGENADNASAAFTFNVIAANVFAPWVIGGISEFGGVESFGPNSDIYDNTPVFNGVAVAHSTVFIAIDGNPVGTAVADAYGRWSFQTTEPLSAGGHKVVGTDALGNTGLELGFSLVDPENINISFNVYADDIGESFIEHLATTADSTPLLRGIAGQDIVLEIFDNDKLVGSVRTALDGTWSYNLNLENGSHNIVVKGEYLSSFTRQFKVEAEAETKVGTIDSVSGRIFDYDNVQPSDGEAIQDTKVVLYGSGQPDAVVELLTVDGISLGFTGVAASGKWYIEVDKSFEDGMHSVIAKFDGVESEPFIFHIGERPAIETQEETFNLFDISAVELLSDSEETLLGKEVEVEAQPATALQLTQADLSITTASGVVDSVSVAHSSLQDEQYQAI